MLGILWSFAFGAIIVSASSPIAALGSDSARLTAKQKRCIVQDVAELRVPFVGNQGQVADENVLFQAQTFGGNFFVTGDGEMVYSIARNQSAVPMGKRAAASKKVELWTVKERLLGCSEHIPRGLDPSQTKVNYFIGSDRSKWTTEIPTFNSVSLGEVYDGIEMSLKAYGKKVEKIFRVEPEADATSIKIQLSGADSLGVNERGELEAKTGIGVIRFSKPVAYQEKNGNRIPVHVAYNVNGSTYGFEVRGYDPQLPLIIDPCLVYSEALGGSSDDIAYAVATGPGDSIYLTGGTYSTDFPVTDTDQITNAGAWDAFVTKLSVSGDGIYGITWSTYLGGALDDYAFGMAVYGSGNAVVTGETWSPDFPTESYYEKKIGGDVDVWVARLTENGELEYSTYLGGGGGTEAGYAVALDIAPDGTGIAYITGVTQASNFPVTPGAAFTRSNGKTNAFVSKLRFSNKISLEASTFLGGNGDDAGYAVVFNGSSVFVTGMTDSADFWQEGTAISPALSGPNDGFLTKFNDTLEDVQYSSYVGGNGEDTCEGIVLNGSSLYLTGATSSNAGFPGCDECTLDGNSDAFVLRLDDNFNDPSPSSIYLGGTGEDAAYGIVLDPDTGSLYVAGRTNSSDLPQFDESVYAGGYDAFMTKLGFGETGYTVVSSSYFGGSGDDAAYGIALDFSGNACLAGSTHGLLGEETLDLDALVAVVSVADSDGDGIADACDNCPDVANGPLAGTCSTNRTLSCSECVPPGYCSMNQEDWDEDGIGDACDLDDDGDGLDDTWEILYGGEGGFALDPYDTNSDDDELLDGEEDFDQGGLPNTGEEDARSNPYMKDTDGDRWTDLWEVQLGTDASIDGSGDYPSAVEVFANGIVVNKETGDDVNLGNVDHPVRSIHAAFDRIERFELGSSNPITISVASGTYSKGDPETDAPLMTSQNVIIKKMYYTDTVIVDGAEAEFWTQGFVFSPLSANVTINGLEIRNFDEAVVFNADGGCATLTSVSIHDCGTGVQLAESYQLNLDLNTSQIWACETGVEICAEGSGNTIQNGTIQCNSVAAVSVLGGTGNQMVGTTIDGPGDYGVWFGMGVEDFTVSGGTIANLDVGIGFATDGMCLTVADATIQNCRAGIEFLENYMINVDLIGSTISGCEAGVLFVAGSSNNTVLGGTLSANVDGIRFEVCADDPVKPEAPDDNQIIGTAVIDNTDRGIAIVAGSENEISNVNVSGSETGVYMGPDSSGNILVGGSVSSIGQNFVLDGSDNTVQDLELQTFGEVSGKGNQLIDVTLDGLSTERYGLLLEPGSEEIILQNVTIQNYDVGIGFATDAACLRLSGVDIHSCRIGVDIRENYLLDIDLGETVISGCDTGIEIAAGSSNNTIRNGFVEFNRLDGILVDGCSESPDENQIIGTIVQDNDRNGIALLAGFGNEVIGCTVTGNNSTQMAGGYGGVVVMNGSSAVKRCRIYNNGCTGVYADDSAVANISGNLIHGHPEGIRLALVSDVTVASNTITANTGPGLIIEEGASPKVAYNILYGNSTSVPAPAGGQPDERYDIFLEGHYEALKLIQNNIRKINQIDLPPSNLSVNPLFCMDATTGDECDDPSENYALQRSSLCIDGTTVAEPGIDVTGSSRPRGNSWDMGAIESSSFRDTDKDGLPDDWEQSIVYADPYDAISTIEDVLPDADYDGDGVSNQQEYEEGSDPTNPVYVRIDSPAERPAFTDSGSIAISGVSVNASGITVTNGGSPGGSPTPDAGGSWSASVSLKNGANVILVTAAGTVDGTAYEATDTITVVNDSANPTVSIVSPTTEGTYTTTLQSITLSGLSNDDTEVSSVSWNVIEDSSNYGDASGTDSWTAGPIELPPVPDGAESVSITVRVTAADSYNKEGSEDIVLTRVPGANTVDEDLSAQGSEPSADDPLDVDGDGYLNDDEVACGSDPLCGDDSTEDCTSGLPATPPNYAGMSYPTGHEKEGYFWPDCLNPDIDGDGLPNWWEEEYFGGSPTAGVAEDNTDLDGLTNLQEYQNGTNPNVAQTIAFTLTVTDLGGGDGLPEFGKTYRIQATWTGDQLETPVEAPAQAVFSLRMTSNYPGRAENDPDPADMLGGGNYPTWYDYHGPDFGLTAAETPDCTTDDCFSQGKVIINDADDGQVDGLYTAYLHSWDYGGRTKVLVTDPVSGNYLGQLWVPENSDKNGIASAWDMDGEVGTANSVDPTALDPNSDTDAIIFDNPGAYTAPLGDDFTHFEEYRGIIYTETVRGQRLHMRLNPFSKDLFVRGVGFYGDYVFEYGPAFANAGITVHDTTNWGHDATDDGSFFVYFGEGAITEITTDLSGQYKKVIGSGTNWSTSWPRHEWEFKLDGTGDWTPIGYWSDTGDELGLDFEYGQGASGSYSYKIRKPVPHINVLIIRHDPTGTFASPDGHIRFVSASQPSQQNPLGTRYWRWATKGYAWCQTTANQSSMYGLAVTLEKPLDSYFNDKPYLDRQTWSNGVWGTADIRLNPLSLVEDQTDQLDPIDGVMGDGPDGDWDGDRRITTFTTSNGDLSPFDIDGDGLVELPLATDPYNITSQEYDLSHVLKHTITHEMAHALAGPSHTNDPLCVMYRYSNNWDRHDHLSDYYKSLLRIHNIVR
jgi:hypothetical protein